MFGNIGVKEVLWLLLTVGKPYIFVQKKGNIVEERVGEVVR